KATPRDAIPVKPSPVTRQDAPPSCDPNNPSGPSKLTKRFCPLLGSIQTAYPDMFASSMPVSRTAQVAPWSREAHTPPAFVPAKIPPTGSAASANTYASERPVDCHVPPPSELDHTPPPFVPA